MDTQEQFFKGPGQEFFAFLSAELVLVSIRENIKAIPFGSSDIMVLERFLLDEYECQWASGLVYIQKGYRSGSGRGDERPRNIAGIFCPC